MERKGRQRPLNSTAKNVENRSREGLNGMSLNGFMPTKSSSSEKQSFAEHGQSSSFFEPTLSERVKMRKRNMGKTNSRDHPTPHDDHPTPHDDQFHSKENTLSYSFYGLDEELILPNEKSSLFVDESSNHPSHAFSSNKSAFSRASPLQHRKAVSNKGRMKNDPSKKTEKEAIALVKGQKLFQRNSRISHLHNNSGDSYGLFKYNVTETSDESPGISEEVQSFPNSDLVGSIEKLMKDTHSSSSLDKLASAVVPKVRTSTSELKQPKNVKAAVLTPTIFSLTKKPTSLMNKTMKEMRCFRRNMQANSKKKAHVSVNEGKQQQEPKRVLQFPDEDALVDIEKLSDEDRPVNNKKRTIQKRQKYKKVTYKEKISRFTTEERKRNVNVAHLKPLLTNFKIPKLNMPATDESHKKAGIATTQVPKEQKKVETCQKTNHITSRKRHIKGSIEHPRSGKNKLCQNNTKRIRKRIVISEDDTSDMEENVCDNESLIQMYENCRRSTLSVNIKKLTTLNNFQSEKEVSDKSELEKPKKFTETTNTVSIGVNCDELSQQRTRVELVNDMEDEVSDKTFDQSLEDIERSPEKVHSLVAMEVEKSERSNMLNDTNVIDSSNFQQPPIKPAASYSMEDSDFIQDDCVILDTVPDKVVPELICLSDDDDDDNLIERKCVINKKITQYCPIISTADSSISERLTTAAADSAISESLTNTVADSAISESLTDRTVGPLATSTAQQPRESNAQQKEIVFHSLLQKITDCEDVDDMAKTLSMFSKTWDQSECQDYIQRLSLDKYNFTERDVECTQTRQTDHGSSNSFQSNVESVAKNSYTLAGSTKSVITAAKDVSMTFERTTSHPNSDIPCKLPLSNAPPVAVVKDYRCVICRKPQPAFCMTCHENCCFNSVCMPKHRRNCQKHSK